MTIHIILMLMIMFIIKHFIADYPLQTAYMLKKSDKENWIKPLLAHCTVHSLLTFGVVFGGVLAISTFSTALIAACLSAIFDGIVHFIVDTIKARKFSKYNMSDKKFWTALGADQMAHYLTYVLIIFLLTL